MKIGWNLEYFRSGKKWTKDRFVTRYEKAYPNIDLIQEYYKIWPEEEPKPEKSKKAKKAKPKKKG